MEKKVLAYSLEFQEMFLSKDVFLIPYYVAKELNLPLKYCYMKNIGISKIPSSHRGATLSSVATGNDFFSMIKCIIFEAASIAVLFLNGSSAKHMFIVWLYKQLNRNGKVLIFGDMEPKQALELDKNEFVYTCGLCGHIKAILTNFFFNNVTYLVANTEAYKLMRGLFERKSWKGLLHFYPCLDDEMYYKHGIVRKSWEEKEKIMICVGRIGNYQKNTEMLLNALKKIDIKDWKIYMLGPITCSFDLKDVGDFQKIIENFFREFPQYVGKLIFKGMIYDTKEIFEYYNRSKVLLMTSRHESWGNVYSEAAAFGCYVLSTDVGGASLTSNNWKFGIKVRQEDYMGLADAIVAIVDEKNVIDVKSSIPMEKLEYSKRIKEVLLPAMNIDAKTIEK